MTTIQEMAATAEKVVEGIMRVEPTIATIAGMFIPGAAPIAAIVQPGILMAIPFLERALNDIAQSNGGDFMGAMIELLQHLSKGSPNSASLGSAMGDASQMGSG